MFDSEDAGVPCPPRFGACRDCGSPRGLDTSGGHSFLRSCQDENIEAAGEDGRSPELVSEFLGVEMASKNLEALAACECANLDLFRRNTDGSPCVENDEFVCDSMCLSEERSPLWLWEKAVDVCGDDALERLVRKGQPTSVGPNDRHLR